MRDNKLLDRIRAAVEEERAGSPTYKWTVVRDDDEPLVHVCSWEKLLVYLSEAARRGSVVDPVAIVRSVPVVRL